MIESLAGKIAGHIKRTVPGHPASYAVLKFSLAVMLNSFFIIISTLGISILTGKIEAAIKVLISFAILRQASGGKHLKSGMACVVVTTLLFTGLSYVEVGPVYVQAMNLVSLALACWLAPIGIEKQTRIPKKHYPKLKLISIALILINVATGSAAIAASFLAQSISLLIERRGVKFK